MRRRYHLPTDITLPEGLSAQDGQGLSATVLAAVRRAVRDAAPGQTPPPPTRHRPRPRERAAGDDRGLHAVPSYDNAGEKVGIPVASPSPRDPANPHNTLTAREMYGIWQKYWVVRRNRAESRFEEVRLSVWRKDVSAYARGTDQFELGHRDGLGPEYRAAVEERDVCRYMLSAKDQVHVWIEAQETLGRPVTLEQVDAQAVEEAKALGFRRTWIDPVVFSVLAAATYPGGPVRSPATGGVLRHRDPALPVLSALRALPNLPVLLARSVLPNPSVPPALWVLPNPSGGPSLSGPPNPSPPRHRPEPQPRRPVPRRRAASSRRPGRWRSASVWAGRWPASTRPYRRPEWRPPRRSAPRPGPARHRHHLGRRLRLRNPRPARHPHHPGRRLPLRNPCPQRPRYAGST